MDNNKIAPTSRPPLKSWFASVRVRTLPLAIAGSLVAAGLAGFYGVFSWPVFVLMILTAALLQILSDYANDYGDFEKGTDNDARKGPKRALQSGTVTKEQMKISLIVLGSLAFLSGIALIVVALGTDRLIAVLGFIVLGIAALAAAIKYTMGKGAYGYHAMGDLAVFLFFGLASVMGGFFLYAGELPAAVALPAVGIGLLSAGVLNLNNMRDVDNDRASGKTTLVVLLGSSRALVYHFALVIGGALCFLSFSALETTAPLQFLYILGFVPIVAHLARVSRVGSDHRAFDPELKPLSMATLLVAVLFSLCINL